MTNCKAKLSLWLFVFLSLYWQPAFGQSPPSITLQPQSQSLPPGTNATFRVTATGQAPLTYQWSFNGTSLTNSSHISGATGSTLIVSNIAPADGGNYQVVVTNHKGSATSSVAVLTLQLPPAITTQPTNVSVVLNSNATFAATASGTAPLSYRWYFNSSPLTNGARVSGSTTTNLNIVNVQTNDAGSYQLVVTNNYGSVISVTAMLTVLVPPGITTQPANQAAQLFSTAVFSVTGNGAEPLAYQWQKDGTNLVNDARVSGATSSTLTISNIQMSDAGDYQLLLTNAYGAVTSAPASLSVVPLAGWGEGYFGELNFPLTLTNVMAIAAGNGDANYLNLALKAGGAVVGWGYTGESNAVVPAGLINAAAISAGYRHGLVLKQDGTALGFSDDGTSETIPTGLNGVVEVSAGSDFSLALQNDGTITAWGGNNSGDATPPPGLSNVVAISAGIIHGLALRGDGTVVGWGFNALGQASPPAGLSNVVAISAGYIHSLALKNDGTVAGWGDNFYGEAIPPAGLSNVVAIAAGYTHSLALRADGTVVGWGQDFYGQATPPSGLSNVVAIAAGGSYSLALLRNPATRVPPSIWWQGLTNQTVPSGQTTAFIPSVSGSLPMNYQWYFNGSPLPGQTNQWLMLPSIQPSQAGDYQFTVSNSYGSVTSQVATVFESPGILTQPANQAVMAGGTATFSATVIGVGTLRYQWYLNGILLTDDGRVTGSTTTNLTISNVQSNDAGFYVLLATNTFGSASSQPAGLTLLIPAALVTQPASQAVLLSSNASFSAEAVGTAPLSFQWYFNGTPLADGGRISGSATNKLSISSVQTSDSGSYLLVITNNYGSATSSVATLTVLVPAGISVQPSNQAALLNGTASFAAAVTGTPPLTYQWYFNGSPLADTGRVIGSATTNLIISSLQSNDFGSYQFIVANDYGSSTSTIVSLIMLVPAAITAQPTNLSVPLSSNASFTVSAVGTAPLGYRWYFNGALLTNNSHFAGSSTTNLIISSAQTNDTGPYQLIVTNQFSAATSTLATLTVYVPVQITAHPASLAVLLGSNAAFSVAASGTSPGYQWFFNSTALLDGPRINGSATPSLSVSSVQPGDAGAYSCLVTNFFSSAGSRKASLTVLSSLTNSVRYVTLNSTNPLAPYLDWTTAATNIQDAVDAAVAGDFVVVSNGTYKAGLRAVYAISNRVVIDKPITVQSVNGPGLTSIQGGSNPTASSGNFRCVYLTNGSALAGFTLTNGSTAGTDPILAKSGGGAWCESSGVVISNCIFLNNLAGQYGGGAFRGTLLNCVLSNNTAIFGGAACSNTLLGCTLVKNTGGFGNSGGGGGASYSALTNCLLVANTCRFNGGGAYLCTVAGCVVSNNSAGQGGGLFLGRAINSLISSNTALYGGGVYSNSLVNCVLKKNAAQGIGGGAYSSALLGCTVVTNSSQNGGGVWGCYVTNSIVYFNGAGGNQQDSRSFVFCCSSPLAGTASPSPGSVTNNPLFVNLASGDFHLQPTSPCINSGNNAFVQAATDFDGNPRIVATVDIGAYEFQPLGRDAFNAWLQQYGLPADGSAIYADPDHDGLNNLQEWIAGTVPTNAASSLRLLSAAPGPAGIAIVWQSVSNRAYFLERSANLAAHPPFTLLASNLSGQDGTTTYTDTSATGAGPYFYRVGVQADSDHLYVPFSVVSYAWLQQYRLPADGTADFADTDHDGMNNWQEWIAGTNPTNAASFLGMKPIIASSSSTAVSWQSVAGKTYFLQRSTNLSAQPPFFTLQSNIFSQSGTTTFKDTNTIKAGPAFYRVGVQQ